MMAIKMIAMFRSEEIRARACVTNISETIREARLRWLGHEERERERETEEDIVMIIWK